jgi:hypothetical protein
MATTKIVVLDEVINEQLAIIQQGDGCRQCLLAAFSAIANATRMDDAYLADLRWEVAALGVQMHNLSKQYRDGAQDSAKQIGDAIRQKMTVTTEAHS